MKIKEINKDIAELVKANGGYCPCAIEKNEDTKCMCREFREKSSGICHCGRFQKIREPHDNKTVAGQALKKLRKQLGLSQKQMAEKIEMYLSYYNSIENGWHQPRTDTLCHIADKFGMNLVIKFEKE